MIAGAWATTQWCAAQLGYQPQLWPACFILFDTPDEAYAPEVFDKAGMLAGTSGFLGRAAAIAGSLWRARPSRHVMAFAPTRSGEGVGLVVPTLLSWTGSAIIHDIKGENCQLTAD